MHRVVVNGYFDSELTDRKRLLPMHFNLRFKTLNVNKMAKKKVVVEGVTPLQLATELNDIVSLWRDTYVLSGHVLVDVKEKVQAIVDSLSATPEETA